jgi:hypothetical protein
MADWVGGASRTLRPLVEALKNYVLSAVKLHGADLPVPVLEPGNGKQGPAACGPTFGMIVRRGAKRHRLSGTLTRRIARANIRPVT